MERDDRRVEERAGSLMRERRKEGREEEKHDLSGEERGGRLARLGDGSGG